MPKLLVKSNLQRHNGVMWNLKIQLYPYCRTKEQERTDSQIVR